jgi:hypothetical protein
MSDERRYMESAVAALDDELAGSSVPAEEPLAAVEPTRYSRRAREKCAELITSHARQS